MMVVLPADQLIRDAAAFRSVMGDAIAAATATDGLVTIGIKPTWPCPSYGYIERGPRATIPGLDCEHAALRGRRASAKSPAPTWPSSSSPPAASPGTPACSSGRCQTVIRATRHPRPGTRRLRLRTARVRRHRAATVAAQFPTLTPISIDYALMEKAEPRAQHRGHLRLGRRRLVALRRQVPRPTSASNNRVHATVTEIDSENNIVFNARNGSHIALLGVDDLIIVQTDDALLIANRHQADAIKKLVEKLLPKELR